MYTKCNNFQSAISLDWNGIWTWFKFQTVLCEAPRQYLQNTFCHQKMTVLTLIKKKHTCLCTHFGVYWFEKVLKPSFVRINLSLQPGLLIVANRPSFPGVTGNLAPQNFGTPMPNFLGNVAPPFHKSYRVFGTPSGILVPPLVLCVLLSRP